MTRVGILLCVMLSFSNCGADIPEVQDAPFKVKIESGERAIPSGKRVAYDLFCPVVAEGVRETFPGVIIIHGFARNKKFHRNTAEYLAARGFVVMTPNMTSLLTGARGQGENIDGVADHVAWLRARATDPEDVLCGLLDPARIALAGHSAGGAVVFEAAAKLANGGGEAALVLLDAVPWQRTLDVAKTLPRIHAASFRSEPAACNANGAVTELLAALPFPVEDIRIVGATHCDPENPTNIVCRVACGGTGTDGRATYRVLLHAFLAEALGAIPLDDGLDYEARLTALEAAGQVNRGLS